MISEGHPGLPEEQGDDGDQGRGGEDDLHCLVTSALLWLGQPLILEQSIMTRWGYWLNIIEFRRCCTQQTTMFSNLCLGVGPDMALVLVLVVGRVTVVHTAGVVAHTGDGHPVGVAEDRGHAGHLAIIIWCSSDCSQVLVEDVNSPGPLCTLSALYTVLCVTPISRASLLHPPASLPPRHKSKHQLWSPPPLPTPIPCPEHSQLHRAFVWVFMFLPLSKTDWHCQKQSRYLFIFHLRYL